MLNRAVIFIGVILSLSIFTSCNSNNGVACTEEFRTVGLMVIGNNLTDTYTIRSSNNDTIRPSDIGFNEDYYIVLDDSYQVELANSQESFEFIGEIDDSIVIQETFVIAADDCHITKVSGPSQITL